MAGSSWEPLSPFLPFLYRASLFFCLSEYILPPDASCPFLCPVCSGSWYYHVSVSPLGRPETHGVGSQFQQVFQQLCSVPLPSSQEEGGRALGGISVHVWGSSSPITWDTSEETRALSTYRGKLRLLVPGREDKPAYRTLIPFPPFPKRGSHFWQAQLRQGLGGAAELGRRQGSVAEEGISHPVKAPPTKPSRGVFRPLRSLLFPSFCLHCSQNPALFFSKATSGWGTVPQTVPWGALSPRPALRPFWPHPRNTK